MTRTAWLAALVCFVAQGGEAFVRTCTLTSTRTATADPVAPGCVLVPK